MIFERRTLAIARRMSALRPGALAVGALVAAAAIGPAAFGRGPAGIVRATGPSAQSAPATRDAPTTAGANPAARSYPARLRSDVVMIELGTGGLTGLDQLEYKVAMKQGSTLIYSWSITDATSGELVLSEFHGHAPDEATQTVAEYSKLTVAADNGALVAPFDGVHGWFFENKSKKPIQIKLYLSGFYALVDAGQPGNELGIPARPIALP